MGVITATDDVRLPLPTWNLPWTSISHAKITSAVNLGEAAGLIGIKGHGRYLRIPGPGRCFRSRLQRLLHSLAKRPNASPYELPGKTVPAPTI